VSEDGTNGTFSHAGEFVTVAQAAARLGVTEPRLRRAVARTGTATQTQTRRTRTGTRTGTVLPVAALVGLAAFLSENGTEREHDGEQKRERERKPTQADAEGFAAPDTPAGNGDAALVAHLTGEVEYLRAALAREQETAKAALDRLAESERRASVLIAATAGAFGSQIGPRIASDDTHGGLSGDRDKVPEGETGSGNPLQKTRTWWRLWKGGE